MSAKRLRSGSSNFLALSGDGRIILQQKQQQHFLAVGVVRSPSYHVVARWQHRNMQHFYRIVVIAICGVVLSDFHFPLQSLKMCSTHRMRNALQREIKPGLCSVADPENFGGGDNKNFKHKTSKIRMSSPKLRLIFRPKSEIQTFFPPKIVV